MKRNLEVIWKKIISWSFYLFIFFLPWQIKYVLKPAENNFNEISLYLCHIFLFLSLISFIFYKLRYIKSFKKLSLIDLLILIFSFLTFVSLFFASNKELALYRFVIYIASLFSFYLIREYSSNVDNKNILISKSKIIFIFLSSVFFHACLAIYQFLTQSSFSCKYLGLAKHNSDVLGTSVVETFSGRWLRSYGGFDHPNILGGVLAFSLILIVYYLVTNKIISIKYKKFQSIFLIIYYFTIFLALIFSFSRSAYLAFFLSSLILFFSLLFKKNYLALKRLVVIFLFTILLSSIIFISYQDLFLTRVNASSRLETKSINERQEQIYEAKDIIKDNYLFGVGLGNYIVNLKEQDVVTREDWNYQPVHNSFLLLFSELGIFAFIIFFVIIFSLILNKKKSNYFWPLVLLLIVLLSFDHWLFSLVFGNLFFFLILSFL